jgi:hypothetical protein
MLTVFLVVPLLAFQAPVDQEPEQWPWDAVLEWDIKYWEWQGDEGAKDGQIPKNARMTARLKLYERFGHQAYSRVDVGNEATLRVALCPRDVDRRLGLETFVRVAVLRPQPQNGAHTGWSHITSTQVFTKDLKFGERVVFGGTSFRAGEKKRAFHAFTLTIQKCERDKKGLIRDYFDNDGSPERVEESKQIENAPPRAGEPRR